MPAREVRLRGGEVRLAAREFDLLAFLARHPRRVFTREQIMQSVWGYTAAIDTGTLSVHVRRLREKIEDDPRDAAAHRDRLERRLPLRRLMVAVRAHARALLARRPASLGGLGLRLLPTLRLRLAGLALLASGLPLIAVVASGLIMFDTRHDALVTLIAAAASASALVGALLVSRSISLPLRALGARRSASQTASSRRARRSRARASCARWPPSSTR